MSLTQDFKQARAERKRPQAIRILDRCRMAGIDPPRWVAYLLWGPKHPRCRLQKRAA